MKKMSSLLIAAALCAVPFAAATEVNVSYSDEFAEKLTEDLGEKEGVYLSKKLTTFVTKELEKSGQNVERVDIVIEDAKPNKPTFEQLKNTPGLDFARSISVGGLEVSAAAFDENGNEVTSLEYDWFEHDIRFAGPTTWFDAKTAARRFAKKLSNKLAAS